MATLSLSGINTLASSSAATFQPYPKTTTLNISSPYRTVPHHSHLGETNMSNQPPKAAESAFVFLSHGAAIKEFTVAGHNIVLGFPESHFYKTHNAPYFGETIGRTTNRVKDARIDELNGKTYQLHVNDRPNCLHGGKEGWGKREWDGPKEVKRGEREGMLFTYLSRDGDEGYPGTVKARVWYTVERGEGGETVLDVEYEVEFVGADGEEVEETVVGVTNHRFVPPHPLYCLKLSRT